MSTYAPLPSGTMKIEDAISYNLRTVPLPIANETKMAINTMLRWAHQGTTIVHVNQ